MTSEKKMTFLTCIFFLVPTCYLCAARSSDLTRRKWQSNPLSKTIPGTTIEEINSSIPADLNRIADFLQSTAVASSELLNEGIVIKPLRALTFIRKFIGKFLLFSLLTILNKPRVRKRRAELPELDDIWENGVHIQPWAKLNSMRESWRSHTPSHEPHRHQYLAATGSGHDDQATLLSQSTGSFQNITSPHTTQVSSTYGRVAARD